MSHLSSGHRQSLISFSTRPQGASRGRGLSGAERGQATEPSGVGLGHKFRRSSHSHGCGSRGRPKPGRERRSPVRRGGERGGGSAGLGCGGTHRRRRPVIPMLALEAGRLRAGDKQREVEVSCIWDETPSFTNARNVQRSIWFCFFSTSPIINSLGSAEGAAAQSGCPLCQEALPPW